MKPGMHRLGVSCAEFENTQGQFKVKRNVANCGVDFLFMHSNGYQRDTGGVSRAVRATYAAENIPSFDRNSLIVKTLSTAYVRN